MTVTPPVRNRVVLSGVLFGVGFAAFVDDTVLHQLLQWHHFYDRSTSAAGIVSDGILHAFAWFAAVASLFLLAAIRRHHALIWSRWIGAALLGAGAFQLFDGTVNHKLLGVHQIRYGVDLLPYDLAWHAVAIALVLAGLVLVIRTNDRAKAQRTADA